MRKLLLLLTILSSWTVIQAAETKQEDTAQAIQAYDPLVKEGKTFWYYQINRYDPEKVQEFGMRIGGKVAVDGDEWNEVLLIRKAEIDTTTNDVLSLSDEPQAIQYIRENNMKVQTKECPGMWPDYSWNALHDKSSLKYLFCVDSDPENFVFDLYDFTPGEEEYIFGTDEFKYSMTLKSEETRDYNGVARRVKTYTKTAFESEIMSEPVSSIMNGQEFELIEGIGVKMVKKPNDEQHYMSELFFAPFCCEQKTSIPLPFGYFLRYVTDENNNVLYEGRGGLRAWTIDSSGLEGIISDTTENVEWYHLSGIRIPAPTQYGVYIRKNGSNAEKVRF